MGAAQGGEGVAVREPAKHLGHDHAGAAQSRDEGGRFQCPNLYARTQTLAALATAIAPRHVGGRRGRVDEDQLLWIRIELTHAQFLRCSRTSANRGERRRATAYRSNRLELRHTGFETPVDTACCKCRQRMSRAEVPSGGRPAPSCATGADVSKKPACVWSACLARTRSYLGRRSSGSSARCLDDTGFGCPAKSCEHFELLAVA